jgi:hypothetical protein
MGFECYTQVRHTGSQGREQMALVYGGSYALALARLRLLKDGGSSFHLLNRSHYEKYNLRVLGYATFSSFSSPSVAREASQEMGVGSNASIHSTLTLPHTSHLIAAQASLLLFKNVGLNEKGYRHTGRISVCLPCIYYFSV